MNNTPVNLGLTRCGTTVGSRGSHAAIQAALLSNIGKTVTIYTCGNCQSGSGFTGLLASVGDGAATLVSNASDGGTGGTGGCGTGCGSGCRRNGCGTGCGVNTGCVSNVLGLSPLTSARLSSLNNVSTVIPICQISALSLPNF